jgi:hypothetical protein
MWRSPTEMRGTEEVGAPTGEAMGGVDRGARWWRDDARHSWKRRSPVEEARGGGGRGTRSGGRHRVDRSSGASMHGVSQLGAGRRGRAGSIETCIGIDQSVGPLGSGDRSLIHHPRR